MTTSHNRITQLIADQKLIDGVAKYFSTHPSLTVGSQTVTPADIVKVLQDRIALAKPVEEATAAKTAAVKAYRDKRAQTEPLVGSLTRLVKAMFEQSPDTLAVFGLTPRKVGKKTVKVKATALQKTAATRTARHTMGTKQKKGVTGAAPSPTTSPAPNPVPGTAAGSASAKPAT